VTPGARGRASTDGKTAPLQIAYVNGNHYDAIRYVDEAARQRWTVRAAEMHAEAAQADAARVAAEAARAAADAEARHPPEGSPSAQCGACRR